MSCKFADSLNNSATFKKFGEKAVFATLVTGHEHWFKLKYTYYTQEITIQTWKSANEALVKQKNPETGKVSFPLDSDRVNVSGDLKDVLVRTGHIKNWTRTNAKRRPKALEAIPIAAVEAVAATMQPPPPAPIQPEQLCLPLDAPQVNLIRLVEAKRQKLGLPQHLVARQLGGLKQAAYANALRGHDKLGAWRRNRALEWIAA